MTRIYSYFNKELRQVFLAITRVWCRKSFPSLFEMILTFNSVSISKALNYGLKAIAVFLRDVNNSSWSPGG